MSRPFSRRLVIDTSIAHASGGEDAVYPTSKRCRDCLLDVASYAHRIVMTEAIKVEWDRHQSHFALRWRTAMQRQGRVIMINAEITNELRKRIEATAETEQQREAIAKPLHPGPASQAGRQGVDGHARQGRAQQQVVRPS